MDNIAIDAGALGLTARSAQQSSIRHVFITHCHLDHIATLPVFLENAYDPKLEPVTSMDIRPHSRIFSKHVFNDAIWPDFVRLPTPSNPFLKLCANRAESRFV